MLTKGRPQDLAVEGAFVITLVEGKKVYNRSVGGGEHLFSAAGISILLCRFILTLMG